MKLKLLKILSGDVMYFNSNSELVDPYGEEFEADQKKTGLLILSKEHYFETVKTFLFDNVREIKNAVKLDILEYSPFETDLFFVKKQSENNSNTRVNLWFIKKDSSEKIKKYSPLFIIPETFLYGLSCAKDQVKAIIKKSGSNYLYISSGMNGIQSQTGTDMEKSFRSFCRSIGSSSHEFVVIEEDKGMKQFRKTISGFTLRELIVFLNHVDFKPDLIKKKACFLISFLMALFIIYNSASVFMISSKLTALKSEDKKLQYLVNDLLVKRETIENMLNDQAVMVEKINEYPKKYKILELLDSILDESTIINSMTISNKDVELSGETINGTVLINSLLKINSFSRIKLISPLSKDKKTGLDRFSLSFIFAEGESDIDER